MLRLQKIRDAVERIVVDDNGAEQRLLRLDIMRRDAVVGLALRLSDNEIPASAKSFDIGHRTGAPESDSAFRAGARVLARGRANGKPSPGRGSDSASVHHLHIADGREC